MTSRRSGSGDKRPRPARRLITGPQSGVTLTPIEWEILEVLIRNTGLLVSQTQSLDPRWAARRTSRRTGACGYISLTCATSLN